jgi:hypothetical protein
MYVRVSPQWQRAIEETGAPVVFSVMPLDRFIPYSADEKPQWWDGPRDGEAPLPSVNLEGPEWSITRDVIVTPNRSIVLSKVPTPEEIVRWSGELTTDRLGCDRIWRDSVYRLTVYHKRRPAS